MTLRVFNRVPSHLSKSWSVYLNLNTLIYKSKIMFNLVLVLVLNIKLKLFFNKIKKII